MNIPGIPAAIVNQSYDELICQTVENLLKVMYEHNVGI